MDYIPIERHVMALYHELPLDVSGLTSVDKSLTFSFVYGGWKQVQRRIDEEGCGAVFAAFRETIAKEGRVGYEHLV